MISKTLGSSRRYAAVSDRAGPLTEFAQLLFPLIVSHADDFGRLEGDAFTIKHRVFPVSSRSEHDFAVALEALHHSGLIAWYDVADRQYIEVSNFAAHQEGLHKRTASKYPAPPACDTTAWEAREDDIEETVAAQLVSGILRIGSWTVTEVIRQYRQGNRYIDLVAITKDGPMLVVECKRGNLTARAIAQVREYCLLLQPTNPQVVPVLLGPKLGLSFPTISDVLVLLMDETGLVRQSEAGRTDIAVISTSTSERSGTVRDVPKYSIGTELNLTEQNRTKDLDRTRRARARGQTVFEGQRFSVTRKMHTWLNDMLGIAADDMSLLERYPEWDADAASTGEVVDTLPWLKARVLALLPAIQARVAEAQREQRAADPRAWGNCGHTPRCESPDWHATRLWREEHPEWRPLTVTTAGE